MKKLLPAVIILIVLGWYFFDPGEYSGPYTNYPPSSKGPWVAFGDSLTSGVGANEGFDYPAQLSGRLGIPIENKGTPGATTAEGLGNIEAVAQLEPRVVLLCLGGNDGLRKSSPETMMNNLGLMIDRFHAAGSFVVLVAVPSVSLRDNNSGRFRQLAKEKKVLLVPNILKGIVHEPKLMSDFIHPNDAGYTEIAKRISTAIAPYVEGLRPQP